MLYRFQAVPPTIIRSSKLYTQHRVFEELFLLFTAIMSELGSSERSFELLMMGGGTA
jgi:hypothetical protein